jgi:peroxiredoxin
LSFVGGLERNGAFLIRDKTMTAQYEADLSLAQAKFHDKRNSVLFDIDSMVLTKTRKYSDGEHRFYEVKASSSSKDKPFAVGTICIMEMDGEPVSAARYGFYYPGEGARLLGEEV